MIFAYFCGISSYLSLFISYFVYLVSSLLFSVNLARDLSTLFVFSKNQVLVLLIFSGVFISILFIS